MVLFNKELYMKDKNIEIALSYLRFNVSKALVYFLFVYLFFLIGFVLYAYVDKYFEYKMQHTFETSLIYDLRDITQNIAYERHLDELELKRIAFNLGDLKEYKANNTLKEYPQIDYVKVEAQKRLILVNAYDVRFVESSKTQEDKDDK